jgi:predicted AAA+ superfamily ATPase
MIIEILDKWACSERRKPLLLRGARQVGKTVAVRMFGQKYSRFIELNLERSDEAALFKQGHNAVDLFQAILLHKNVASAEGNTLLFIDEIQECPEAVKMLRYFKEDLPEIHLIAAGSLLEIALSKAQINFPVGRVEHLFIYPLSFVEFLTATGNNEVVTLLENVPVPGYAHETILKLFHRYVLIGGMPEIVAEYIRKRDISDLSQVYKSLLQSYIDDIPKYARNETMVRVLSHCIKMAPLSAGSRITFAGFGESNYRSREVGEALRTLEKALMLNLFYPTLATQIPIRPNYRKSPRLQFIDTGLLNYCAGLQEQFFLHKDLHSLYRGILAEHIVGQELICSGTEELRTQCFWVRDSSQSQAEVDFVIQHREKIIPVEVKAGKTGRLRSLHLFMDMCPHGYAVRLYSGPILKEIITTPNGKQFTLINLPYYLASKLHKYLDWAENTVV